MVGVLAGHRASGISRLPRRAGRDDRGRCRPAPSLALDQEARSIHVELKRSGFRDRFDFVTRWAVEPLDLLRELRELRPTVVHFSGHGTRPVAATEPAQTTEPAHTGDQVQTAEPAPSRDVIALGPRPGGGSGGLVVNDANGHSRVISLRQSRKR